MKKHLDDNQIIRPMAYFRKIVKRMDKKDELRDEEWNKLEPFLDEIYLDNRGNDCNIDEQMTNQNLLNWIDLLDNQILYNAVKSLSIDEQIFISQFFCSR